MKRYYPAVFTAESDGFYSIIFPDVPEAITCGENLEHGIAMAKECLELCLNGRREDGETIPEADYNNISCKENQIIILIDFERG